MSVAKYVFACVALAGALFAMSADGAALYRPSAIFCAVLSGRQLCPVIPGNVGKDPPLTKPGYTGVLAPLPKSADRDVQSPFDNYSWQVFVALNWAAGQTGKPARQGLNGEAGPRVWESWKRVSEVFGPAPGLADCGATPGGLERFDIGSDKKGTPVAENEEYIQAATGDPVIDVSGNWTVYERRVDDVEIAFLQAPYGNAQWTLTTIDGQQSLLENYTGKPQVVFPTAGQGGNHGPIEIKAAWRILDPTRHTENAKKYYVVRAFLTVAPDLVRNANGTPGGKICAKVDLGLVAMHIIQKNPHTGGLEPDWIWSTFEHIDNDPVAKEPCDPANPDQCVMDDRKNCPAAKNDIHSYAYYDKNSPDSSTNDPPQKSPSPPQFAWNPQQPYALSYLRPSQDSRRIGSQVTRCWSIYSLTQALNQQWRAQLAKAGSVFANYMLVGSQWAFVKDAPPPNPLQFLPKYLANTLVETYVQRAFDESARSCMACHQGAQITPAANLSATTDFSFLPHLATPPGQPLIRRAPIQ